MTICAIHQPNFLPWAGYFDKIRLADIFIFLDEVPYPKSGSGAGSWCNRVKMMNGGTPSWFGLPINRKSGVQLIKDVQFANKEYNLKKIVRSFEHNYKKAKHYQALFPLIESIFYFQSNNLSEYNINAITQLARLLKLKTTFIKQSELSHQSHSNGLLIELIKQVEADSYLCGNGAGDYQEDHLFAEAGIKLIYQDPKPAQNFITTINAEESSLSMLHLLVLYYEEILRKYNDSDD